MNRLKGKILELQVDGALTLVRARVGDNPFTAIVIDNPETTDYLEVGNEIDFVFKETEVIIARPDVQGISLQNQVAGAIATIETGPLLSRLTIETDSGPVSSIITSAAVNSLELSPGSEVLAMVKTNEVMLAAP